MKTISLLSLFIAAALPFSANAATAKKKKAAEPKTQVYAVNPATSKITWEGKKITNATHHGELTLKSGKLMASGAKLLGGEFEVDMTSLKDLDLTDPAMNKKLIDHLRSDDFFAVEKFPTAKFVINKVEEKEGKQSITGDLTIKGTTAPLTFPAEVTVDAKDIQAKGTLTVDRTKYDVRFGSTKYFPNLGDKVINDNFLVNVDIKAQK